MVVLFLQSRIREPCDHALSPGRSVGMRRRSIDRSIIRRSDDFELATGTPARTVVQDYPRDSGHVMDSYTPMTSANTTPATTPGSTPPSGADSCQYVVSNAGAKSPGMVSLRSKISSGVSGWGENWSPACIRLIIGHEFRSTRSTVDAHVGNIPNVWVLVTFVAHSALESFADLVFSLFRRLWPPNTSQHGGSFSWPGSHARKDFMPPSFLHTFPPLTCSVLPCTVCVVPLNVFYSPLLRHTSISVHILRRPRVLVSLLSDGGVEGMSYNHERVLTQRVANVRMVEHANAGSCPFPMS